MIQAQKPPLIEALFPHPLDIDVHSRFPHHEQKRKKKEKTEAVDITRDQF